MHSRTRPNWLGVGCCLGTCVLLAGCRSTLPQFTQATPAIERTPKLNAAQKSDLKVALAQSLERSGSPQDAIAAYQHVLKQDPQHADACNRLAILHGKQGQWDQALTYHKKALAGQPGNADYHCNLGYTYYLQRRWGEAEMSFKKAIELAPEHARAHVNLGLVQAHAGQEQLARASFRRGGCTETESFSNLAFVSSLENSLPAAQSHYQRALALDPSNTAAQSGQKMVAHVSRKPAATPVVTQPPVTTPIAAVTATMSSPLAIPNTHVATAPPIPLIAPQTPAAQPYKPAVIKPAALATPVVATTTSPPAAATVHPAPTTGSWTRGYVTFDVIEPSAESAEAIFATPRQSRR